MAPIWRNQTNIYAQQHLYLKCSRGKLFGIIKQKHEIPGSGYGYIAQIQNIAWYFMLWRGLTLPQPKAAHYCFFSPSSNWYDIIDRCRTTHIQPLSAWLLCFWYDALNLPCKAVPPEGTGWAIEGQSVTFTLKWSLPSLLNEAQRQYKA